MRTPTKKPAPIGGSVSGPEHIELNYLRHQYNPTEFDQVCTERDTYRNAYEHVLWAYSEGICRTSPERLEYLMSVELPFHFQPDVFNDLEFYVDVILKQPATGYPQKVAA